MQVAGTDLVVALQSGESRRSLQVHDLDELCTEIGVHGRDQTPGLQAVLDDTGGECDSLGI